jgi:hypothetical protein
MVDRALVSSQPFGGRAGEFAMFSHVGMSAELLLGTVWEPVAIGLLFGSVLLAGFFLTRWRRYRGRRLVLAETRSSPAARDQAPSTMVMTERRRSPRRWGLPIEVVLCQNVPGARQFRGWIVNRAEGGLGLTLPELIPVGTQLLVRVHNAPQSVPWTAVEVKSCSFQVNRWIAGCQFVEQPSREVMLLFG